MTDQEVNKVIAKFMGLKNVKFSVFGTMYQKGNNSNHVFDFKYTESLDALVPVWEKIKLTRGGIDEFVIDLDKNRYGYGFWMRTLYDYGSEDIEFLTKGKNSVQQAAAHATSKAILELEK